MKEINHKEQNYEHNINKKKKYSNQLNQIKLALGNRLQPQTLGGQSYIALSSYLVGF
jgi:hypothetical protein